MENDTVRSFLGMQGKMISGSKSGYREKNPKSLAIFNSNVCVVENERGTKIWYGDIDITKSRENLKGLASELGTDIYVLFEMDARFEHEEKPIIGRFAYKVSPDGYEELGYMTKDNYDLETLERNGED
jgi:hypothetical protein